MPRRRSRRPSCSASAAGFMITSPRAELNVPAWIFRASKSSGLWSTTLWDYGTSGLAVAVPRSPPQIPIAPSRATSLLFMLVPSWVNRWRSVRRNRDQGRGSLVVFLGQRHDHHEKREDALGPEVPVVDPVPVVAVLDRRECVAGRGRSRLNANQREQDVRAAPDSTGTGVVPPREPPAPGSRIPARYTSWAR